MRASSIGMPVKRSPSEPWSGWPAQRGRSPAVSPCPPRGRTVVRSALQALGHDGVVAIARQRVVAGPLRGLIARSSLIVALHGRRRAAPMRAPSPRRARRGVRRRGRRGGRRWGGGRGGAVSRTRSRASTNRASTPRGASASGRTSRRRCRRRAERARLAASVAPAVLDAELTFRS
jgi:hypothetical protein